MRLALLAFGLVFFSVCVLAFTQTIEVQLQPDGTASVTHQIQVQNETGFSIPFLATPTENPNTQFSDQTSTFQIQENQIVFSNLQPDSTISLSYSTNALTNKKADEWFIDLNQLSPTLTQFRVLLLPQSKITQFQPTASIFFEDPRLVIVWQENQLRPPAHIRLAYTTTQTGSNPWPTILLAVALLSIIIGGLVLWNANKVLGSKPLSMHSEALKHPLAQTFKGFSSGQTETIKTLSEKETKLLEILLTSDGCTQKNLLHQSGLSKATLSRTLKLLEQKELVRLVPDGYSNKVFLTDWFKNK